MAFEPPSMTMPSLEDQLDDVLREIGRLRMKLVDKERDVLRLNRRVDELKQQLAESNQKK